MFKLPPLTTDEFRSLCLSISKHGIQDPIIYTKDKTLISGANRLRAAKTLGIKDVPKRIIPNVENPESLILEMNVAGRQISTETKKLLAAYYLKQNPEQSARMVADQVGLDHKTVSALKAELVKDGKIPKSPVKGKDGKTRKRLPVKATRKRKDNRKVQTAGPAAAEFTPTVEPGARIYLLNYVYATITPYVIIRETPEFFHYMYEGREQRTHRNGTFLDWAKAKADLLATLLEEIVESEAELTRCRNLLAKAEGLQNA